MNRTEHLLTVLAEEAVEVAKEVSKALRFGIHERMDGPPYNSEVTNAERINREIAQFDAMVDWLRVEGILPQVDGDYEQHYREKKPRVTHYMGYAESVGALTGPFGG